MAIGPVGPVTTLISREKISPLREPLLREAPEAGSSGAVFRRTVTDFLGSVQEAQTAADQAAVQLAAGQSDDPHALMIQAARADIALQTMIQLRNKVLEAYSEVMRINL